MQHLAFGVMELVLVLAGVVAGGVVVAMFARSRLARVHAAEVAASATAAQHAEQRDEARSQLQALRDTMAEHEQLHAHTDRTLAAAESTVQNLRERLAEAHANLDARELDRNRLALQVSTLEKSLAELQAVHTEKLAGFQEMKKGFEQSRAQLKTEFENLASQILEEKGRVFAHNSRVSLDAMLKPLRDQIDSFQSRVNQVHDETVRGNASLGSEVRRVMEMGLKISAEANTLAQALKGDKKTTGNWGEIQLETTLELAGLMKDAHFKAQPRFKDGEGNSRQPDFVVTLPDQKHMVIDSKVSLVDYERAVAATELADREAALDAHVKAVRNHIDDLARKDYTNLVGMRSPSFVLMFMPIEPAYIEALRHSPDLFEYGYRSSVILVSHTTLMPILKTVANLWMMAHSNEEAQALSDRAGDVYNQVVVVAERLKKLGDTLETVRRQYNSTVTAVAGQQGLHGKAARFGELSSKAHKRMPDVEPLHADFESERLDLIVTPVPEPDTDQASGRIVE
ncbi:DNA recombination protein RmuC [Pusillimonas sp. ANT_WB101]|uniref:DNA recombination protein RmuC n=1 Tax=Pusillimonas sp. ANT_WB101 TaxID=2597356 RepID=UPI00210471B3|nr:DNA recombination protein RmuC [Pusillimonas sp. ANT_WB101]